MAASNPLILPENCPPDGAVGPDGIFYRLARPALQIGASTAGDDWQLPLHTPGSAGYAAVDVCTAYAFSIYDDADELANFRRASPWARKKSVARVVLSPEMGRISPSRPDDKGHRSFWPSPADLVPDAEVVEEGSAA